MEVVSAGWQVWTALLPQAGRQRIWKPSVVWEPGAAVWELASPSPLFRNPISAMSKYALILQTLPLVEKEQAFH